MKIRYASDIHLEFGLPVLKKQLFPKGGKPEDEILFVDGDTMPATFLEEGKNDAQARSLRKSFNKFLDLITPYSRVYFTAGNHDYYHGDINTSRDIFNEYLALRGKSHMRMIEDEAIVLGDTIILACTLWTNMNKNNPLTRAVVGRGMNDFRLIRNGDRRFTPEDAYDIHQRSLSNLGEMYHYHTYDFEKRKSDGKTKIIVVTHHAPSYQSVAESYRHGGSDVDYGYYSELDDWVLDRPQITHWIHGHTHHNVNYMIGNCNVVTNCRGYGIDGYKDASFDTFTLDSYIELGDVHAKDEILNLSV